jgi:hypothetical protein
MVRTVGESTIEVDSAVVTEPARKHFRNLPVCLDDQTAGRWLRPRDSRTVVRRRSGRKQRNYNECLHGSTREVPHLSATNLSETYQIVLSSGSEPPKDCARPVSAACCYFPSPVAALIGMVGPSIQGAASISSITVASRTP